jgi:hypothetical protein
MTGWEGKMAINKTILKKIAEKTKNDKKQKEFIVKILDEENKGLGQFTKVYEKLIKESVWGGQQ